MKESKCLRAWGLTSQDIQNMLMIGMTMPEIAKRLNINYISLVNAYKVQKKGFKYINLAQTKKKVKGIKKVSFTFNKEYNEKALNQNELLAYYNYEKKHKAYYEYRSSLL